MGKYSELSKDELLKIVEKQDEELRRKKYGLVWEKEREPEKVVIECAKNLPVLDAVDDKTITTDTTDDNILIEGDNYHALSVLCYTHKEKIDVIYIDPPYNTGNKDFVYNDRYVDKEDKYRHSKWLNFMEKRLLLAKELLKETGAIFISIDDNEMAQLKLLCDRVFGEENFVANAIWEKIHSSKNDAKYFSENHEYLVCFAKNKQALKIQLLPRTEEMNKRFSNPDNDERGDWASGDLVANEERKEGYYDVVSPSGQVFNVPTGKHWVYSKENMMKLIEDNRIWFGKNGNAFPRLKRFLSEVQQGKKASTLWFCEEVGHNQEAKRELRSIADDSNFSTPKPIRLINRVLNVLTTNSKPFTILDFFAGSGTTGHAVLELNREDGGNRKFILCTNNENGICENITYPRLSKAINGYHKNGNGEAVDGLGGNLRYFKTSLLPKSKSPKQLKAQLTKQCVEMLCVKENIFNARKQTKSYKIFVSNDNLRLLGVYFDTSRAVFEEFLDELRGFDGQKAVYIFSDSGKVDGSLFAGVKNCRIEEIPQKILDVYKRLVKLNVPSDPETIFIDFEKARKRVFEEKDKDDGARVLRVVLEKVTEKIASQNGVNISIFGDLSRLNDHLKNEGIIDKVLWEENKTYIAIGNSAAHGDYEEYDMKQVENFYRHIQNLLDKHIG